MSDPGQVIGWASLFILLVGVGVVGFVIWSMFK